MSEPAPLFSVIIPSKNRPVAIRRCVESLVQLVSCAPPFEVIVVDDGSRVPCASVLQGLSPPFSLQIIRLGHRGVAAARNAGVARARGRWLAFVDDDCVPEPGWLSAFFRELSRAPNCLAGGKVINGLRGNLYSEASQLLVAYLYHAWNGQPYQARFFVGCNMACPRETFLKLGGFDESFLIGGEDRELCRRWRRVGHPLCYVDDAVVRHYHELNLTSFIGQHFRYGRGAWDYRRVCRRDGDYVPLESLGWYIGLLTWPFRRPELSRQESFLISLLLGVAQLANAVGFLSEVVRRAIR